MAFTSIDEPGFWQLTPDSVRFFQTAMEEMFDSNLALLALGDGSGLADADDLSGPLVAALRLGPNEVIPPHYHTCHRIEVVIKGQLTVSGRVLEPGGFMLSAPGEVYGPLMAGPEGSVSVEMFSDASGVIARLPEDASDDARAKVARMHELRRLSQEHGEEST